VGGVCMYRIYIYTHTHTHIHARPPPHTHILTQSLRTHITHIHNTPLSVCLSVCTPVYAFVCVCSGMYEKDDDEVGSEPASARGNMLFPPSRVDYMTR
jgi:hypothetical protein